MHWREFQKQKTIVCKKNTRFGTRSEYSTRFRIEQINLFCFSDLYAQSRIFIPDFVILINPFHKSPKKLFEYNRKKSIYYGSNNVNHYIVKAASTSDKSHKTHPFSLTLAQLLRKRKCTLCIEHKKIRQFYFLKIQWGGGPLACK